MRIILPNLLDTKEQFSLSKKEFTELNTLVVESATDSLLYEWRNLASKELRSTRSIYLRNVFKPEYQVNGDVIRGIITLNGVLPNMIESGAPPFDLKIGMQHAKNVKHKKDGGWYVSINMRHATPKALGENEVFSNILPQPVYQEAKKLKPMWTDLKKQKFGYGESLKKEHIPSPHDILKKSAGYGTFEPYQHKHSIYEGLMRQQKTYEKVAQSTYSTFRTISDKSDPNSWIHPGFIAKNFADRAVEITNFDTVVERTTIKFLQSLGY